MSQLGISSAAFFGKIPSRGDFVKGGGPHQLIAVLDRWASQGMAQLSEDPRWKTAYDGACPLDFMFVGVRSRLSVVGHLRPSVDASGRRFPFIAAAMVERDDTLMFRCAPAGLTASLSSLARKSEHVVNVAGMGGAAPGGVDVSPLLAEFVNVDCATDFEQAMRADPLGNFVARNTLGSLSDLLPGGHASTVRRIVLAIGLLMRPLLGKSEVAIDKEIVLPLPADERQRHAVAGLWLYLLTAFLTRTDAELQVIVERRVEKPRMIVGFSGSSPTTLMTALSPELTLERTIPLTDPEWIDAQAEVVNDYGVAKLSSYLAHPGISLEQAIGTFREVFLGE